MCGGSVATVDLIGSSCRVNANSSEFVTTKLKIYITEADTAEQKVHHDLSFTLPRAITTRVLSRVRRNAHPPVAVQMTVLHVTHTGLPIASDVIQPHSNKGLLKSRECQLLKTMQHVHSLKHTHRYTF